MEVKKLVQVAYMLGVTTATTYLASHESMIPIDVVVDAITSAEYVMNTKLTDCKDREELKLAIKKVIEYLSPEVTIIARKAEKTT